MLRGGLVVHCQLLHGEIGFGIQEHEEGMTTLEMHADDLELLVQTTDDVKHLIAVGDDLTQVTEHVCRVLEVPTVICDG